MSVTKVQKREKVRKASVQRRVASALAKFLHQANPAMKTAGASIQRLKGGVLKITPIKANAGRRDVRGGKYPCEEPNCPVAASVRMSDQTGNTVRACKYHKGWYLDNGWRVVGKYKVSPYA